MNSNFYQNTFPTAFEDLNDEEEEKQVGAAPSVPDINAGKSRNSPANLQKPKTEEKTEEESSDS